MKWQGFGEDPKPCLNPKLESMLGSTLCDGGKAVRQIQMPTVLKLKVVLSDEWLNVHVRPRMWPLLGESGGLPHGEGFPLMELSFWGPDPAQGRAATKAS